MQGDDSLRGHTYIAQSRGSGTDRWMHPTSAAFPNRSAPPHASGPRLLPALQEASQPGQAWVRGSGSHQGACGAPLAAWAERTKPTWVMAAPSQHSPSACEERIPFTRRSKESRDTSMYSMLLSWAEPSLPPNDDL